MFVFAIVMLLLALPTLGSMFVVAGISEIRLHVSGFCFCRLVAGIADIAQHGCCICRD